MIKNILIYLLYSSLLLVCFVLSVNLSDKFKGRNYSDVGVSMYSGLSFVAGFFFLVIAVAAITLLFSYYFKTRTSLFIKTSIFFSLLFFVVYYFLFQLF